MASKATLVAIPSLMSKWSETRDYQVHDFVHRMVQLGIGKRMFHYAIVNTTEIPPELLAKYKEEEKSEPMLVRDKVDLKELKKWVEGVYGVDLLSKQGLRKGFVRHDPRKVAHALMNLLSPSTKEITAFPLSKPSADLSDAIRRLDHNEMESKK